MNYERLIKIFDKINATTPNEIPPMSLTEVMKLWEELSECNKHKDIYAESNTDWETLIKFYIVEYSCFSLAVDHKDNRREILLYNSLFTSITNTVFAILKLAIDGLDYSAKVLFRNLLELMLTLITVLIDKTKGEKLMDALKNDDTKTVWHKHFTLKKMIETISQHKKLEGNDFFEWLQERYSHFSSYAHNDFMAMVALSHSMPQDEDGTMQINLCGSLATRTENLLGDLAELCYIFNLLFFSVCTDEENHINKNTFGFTEETQELWKNAIYLNFLNKSYYEEIIFEESQNDQL